MRRHLIVGNRTLGGAELADTVRERMAAGPAAFHILVPAPPGDDRAAVAESAERLEAERSRLSALGATVSGDVVEAEPIDAVRDLLDRESFDEVIVCTLPPGLSRWLRGDLVQEIRELSAVPVLHLTAPAGLPARMTSRAVRLTVYLGETDRHGGKPLYHEIVRRARAAGLAGATVLRGLEGFGASKVVHTARLLTLSEDLPMVVVVIDTPDRIDAFLPVLDELLTEGLVVREDIDVMKYAGRPAT